MSTEIASSDEGNRRLDLQGLRGLAIIPGFVYHMTGILPGIVVFIDMFFAMSGYLITGRLIHLAQTRSVRSYYYEFYKFRVKRLLPAAVAVIVVTTILAWLLFVPSRAHSILADAVASTFFFANVRFALEDADYMHRSNSESPLLTFWSLSVEEQFYLVWPVVVLLLIVCAAHRRQARSMMAWASAIVLVASFSYGYWLTREHPVAAYYDTPTRAWEFAVGALLAVYAMRERLSHPPESAGTRVATSLEQGAGRVRDLLNRHASAVSLTGVAVFIVAIFAPVTDGGFPVPWGAMGVLGCALVIFAGIDQRPRNWFLQNRFITWVGDISYSVYLVHFPVIIFAAVYLSSYKPMLYAFDIVATISASLVLFYFVEHPGRRGFKVTAAWIRAGHHRPAVQGIILCAALATIVFTVAPKSVAPTPVPVESSPSGPTSLPPSPEASRPQEPAPRSFSDPNAVKPTSSLEAALTAALALNARPRLSNPDRIENQEDFLGPCDALDPLDPPCIAVPASGTNPAKVALALGDSTMLAYWPMLRDAMVPLGWTVIMDAHIGCTAAMVSPSDDEALSCSPTQHASYPDMFEKWKPTLVLASTNEEAFSTLPEPDGGSAVEHQNRAYVEGMRTTIDLATRHQARFLLLSPPPVVDLDRSPSNCLVAGASMQNCTYTPAEKWFNLNSLDRRLDQETAASYANLLPFLCSSLLCPGVVDGVVVHADSVHLSPEYAAMLAPSFSRYLVRTGLTR